MNYSKISAAGAAVGGLLALLVGTKSGRKALSPVIKIGSVAALGALGYKAYQKWQEKSGQSAEGKPINHLEGPAVKERSTAILQAMIGAANADRNIDVEEREAIMKHVEACELESEAATIFMDSLQNPVVPSQIAALSNSPEMSVELYLASLAVTGIGDPTDEAYLSDLAASLNLAPELIEEIRAQVIAT